MVKACELTPHKKAVIIALNNERLSSRVISDPIGFNHLTVIRLFEKFRQTECGENEGSGTQEGINCRR